MKPIKLTDAELDAVFSAARPLDPDLRDPFLQAVAHALQQDCSSEIGPGTVARVCREMQRQFFDSPDSTAPCRAGRVRVAVSGPPRKLEAVLSVDSAGLPAMVGVITSAWPTSAGWQAYPPPP